MAKHYHIQEFAELAGVTVKALHHYDRLGLLTPGRTDSGYRVYQETDLQTLEQIIALKFLGLPLKDIATVLKRPALHWRDTLRLQRQALEDRQELLRRAITAIRAAEEAIDSGDSADPATLKHVIEVIDMQQSVEQMKKYYSEESWEQHRRYYEEGPSAEWRKLYDEARTLLGEDPASPKSQELVERWQDLSRRAHGGDARVPTDSAAAWMDRANWPDSMKQRAAEFQMEEVHAFIHRAELASRKQIFSERAWTKMVELQNQAADPRSSQWRDRVQLFQDLEAAAGGDPAGERAQALVARWKQQLDAATGGDSEIKEAMLTGWSHRRNWPESQRWRIERLHMMSYERFEKAADYLDTARGVSGEQAEQAAKGTPKTMLREVLLNEFDEEMSATRSLLERVPDDKFAWRPHERAFTLGKLANHVAAMPGVAALILIRSGFRPLEEKTTAALLASFEKNVAACREQLDRMSEERLSGNMLVNPGVEKPVWAVLRGRGLMNHLIHHRGQLSLYLRILGVAVPGMYGPSADDK
ncbi:MAG TPA: DinB family protein [Terriglobales bacterium]